MKDKIFLVFYIIFIILLTSYHNLYFLIFFSFFLFIISFKNSLFILKKTIFSIIIFNSIICLSYFTFSYIKGEVDYNYFLMINLRVFNLTFMTFLLIKKINIFKAISFSRNITFVLNLAYSQILSFLKIVDEFKLSFKSRSLNKQKRDSFYNFILSMLLFFFNKSYNNLKEISFAMKSRGFFK